MKTRTDLLNFLAEKYNLKRYLEIGIQDPKQNFYKINCDTKIGIDPALKEQRDRDTWKIFSMTSDQFFKHYFEMGWVEENEVMGWSPDLVFIDGLHTAEQVKKDFENALKVLSPNGFIVLHDCNPEKEEHTIVPRPTERGHWNGDVYKFAASLLNGFTVDIDNGCRVIPNGMPVYRDGRIQWSEFIANRKEYLNLITWNEFISTHSHV